MHSRDMGPLSTMSPLNKYKLVGEGWPGKADEKSMLVLIKQERFFDPHLSP
jgi:hypothetical protein